jgi:hypothetical protein
MHLYLIELSSDHKPKGEPRQITFESGQQNSPVWTPDGGGIVFISGVFQNAGLWRVPVSGGRPGKPERLAFAGNEVRDVAISEMARRLPSRAATAEAIKSGGSKLPSKGIERRSHLS